jgi:hypothetical protein
MTQIVVLKWLVWMIAINTLTLLANNFLITIMMGWFDSPFGQM